MTLANVAFYGKRVIRVDDALPMRDRARERREELPLFRCLECGERVSPVTAGGGPRGTSAHFAHASRNPNCSLSDGGAKAPAKISQGRTSMREPVVEVHSGRFPDPESRERVERGAVDHVTADFTARGYQVTSVESENLGYDLVARRGKEEQHLEVKGTSGKTARFFLSRNERGCGAQDGAWRLALVTDALNTPTMEVYPYSKVEDLFQLSPLAWECCLKPDDQSSRR